MGSQESTPQRGRKQKGTVNDTKYQDSYQVLFNPLRLDTTKTFFNQSTKLAEGMFNLFVSVKTPSYQSFIEALSYLTKLDIDISINQRFLETSRKTSIMDRFMMLIYQVQTYETFKNIEVTKEQKANCIFQFFSLFCVPNKNNLQRVHELIPNFADKQMLSQFSEKLKNSLHYSQKFLINYFVRKFEYGKKRFLVFENTPESNLLSIEDWIMMASQNPNIGKNQPRLLYSLEKTGSSFHSLYRHLIGYQGPWLLALSHYQTDAITKQLKLCIFGSYQNVCMQDISTYQGNSQGFLFRLSPNQKYFPVSKGDGESNYVYINTTEIQTSKMPRGIGFGGKNKQDFKLWIDESMQSKSYVGGKQDGTYGYGSIAFSTTSNLKIRDLQIWGLGDERSLQFQQQYWQARQQQAYKRRKVNKKQLLSGGLTNILFQNTFKHRQQVYGQIDNKKDQNI